MIEYPDDYGSHDHSHSHTNDWENHSQEPNGHNQIPQCFNSACDCHRPSLDHQRGESIDNSSSESVVNVPSVVPTTDTAEKCKSSPHCSHNTNGRDLNKPCSVSIPNTDTSDWEKDFEMARPDATWMPKQVSHEEESEVRFFGYKYFSKGNIHEVTDWGHIKSFIRKVVEHAREEGKNIRDEKWEEEIYKAGRALALSELREFVYLLKKPTTKYPDSVADVKDIGYNAALDHILTQLSNDTK